VAAVSTTPEIKISAAAGVPLEFPRLALRCRATSTKRIPRSDDPSPAARTAAATRPARAARLGSSAIRKVPRPNIPIVPSNVIADVVAAA
jgi:hypothetical protein